jgi:hypothetical protein
VPVYLLFRMPQIHATIVAYKASSGDWLTSEPFYFLKQKICAENTSNFERAVFWVCGTTYWSCEPAVAIRSINPDRSVYWLLKRREKVGLAPKEGAHNGIRCLFASIVLV